MDYKVQVSDKDGESFRVRLSIPFRSHTTNIENSSFHVLDSGFIRYASGGCRVFKGAGFAPHDIALITFDTWGLLLNVMFDVAGFVNSSGSGKLVPAWATGAKPGAINWALLS